MSDLDDIFAEDWPEDHRSGVVAVVGRPNVGKSTLINRILGQKIAIVTDKPQTTRKQQLGIYTEPNGQILFTDTPGLHRPHHKLGEYMVDAAEHAIKDADLILWVLDSSQPLQEGDRHIAATLERLGGDTPVVLALNKTDQLAADVDLSEHLAIFPHDNAMQVSGLQGTGVAQLVEFLLRQLPHGPRYYPADQVSEVNMRFVAAEVIREKIILNTEQEIPHSVAVGIEEYKERSEGGVYINATIYVERDSQKGILIGKGGEMIKRLGSESRRELEDMLETKVFLDLHIKVLKNWRSDPELMKRLGYRQPKMDKR
ncbi:MAG: GTPase Era [bacterium]|nr:GTPase Era [bacterium]